MSFKTVLIQLFKLLARLQALLEKNDEAKALEILRIMLANERHWRLRRCHELLPVHMCHQKSSQPFNLMAKLTASRTAGSNGGAWNDELLKRIMMHIRRIR